VLTVTGGSGSQLIPYIGLLISHDSQSTDHHFSDNNKVEILEQIVRHFTGHVELSNATLGQIARSLQYEGQQADERDKPNNCTSSRFADDGNDTGNYNDNEGGEFTIDTVSSTTAGKPLYDASPFHILTLTL